MENIDVPNKKYKENANPCYFVPWSTITMNGTVFLADMFVFLVYFYDLLISLFPGSFFKPFKPFSLSLQDFEATRPGHHTLHLFISFYEPRRNKCIAPFFS